MNDKKYWITISALLVLLLISFSYNFTLLEKLKQLPSQQHMTSQTEQSTEQQSVPDYDELRKEVLSDMEKITETTESFLHAYFTVDSTKTGYINAEEVYNAYAPYLTDSAKEEHKPEENAGEDFKPFEFKSEVGKIKVYCDDFTKDECKTLAILLIKNEIGGKPTIDLKMINFQLKKIDDVWLIDTMLEAQDVRFDERLDKLFA